MTTLPVRAAEIVHALYRKFFAQAHGSDDDRRVVTKKICEQLRFELGPRWGWKAAAEGRPPSKDAFAYKLDSGLLNIWDWQNGASREPQVQAGSPAPYQNEAQFFIEVEPVDHLGATQPPPPPPPPPPPGEDLKQLMALVFVKLEAIENVQKLLLHTAIPQVLAELDVLEDTVTREAATLRAEGQRERVIEIGIPLLGTAKGRIK